jgi:hypothetical protein
MSSERAANNVADGSGPRVVDETQRDKDSEALRAFAAHFSSVPHGTMTAEDREIFAEHRRRRAAGERGISQEERNTRRRASAK